MKKSILTVVSFAFLTAITLGSCREKKTADDKLDNAIENVEDAAEEVGDEIEDAGDKIEDAVD